MAPHIDQGALMKLKGNIVADWLDALPSELIIGLAAVRFLSTAPIPRRLDAKRTVLLAAGKRHAGRAFLACFPTIFMLLAWALVGYNYYIVKFLPSKPLWMASNAVGHLLLALQVWAYQMTLNTHPGGPPDEWRAAATAGRVEYYVCRRTGRLLPPRAYHIRQIREDILALDHFCFWLNRPIGLRNRKFFLLFLAYSGLVCALGLALCACRLYALYQQPAADAWLVLPFLSLGMGMVPVVPLAHMDAAHLSFSHTSAANLTGANATAFGRLSDGQATWRTAFRGTAAAFVGDLVALLFLCGFGISAWLMAVNGRVSLNPNDASWDVGTRQNMTQIFGAPRSWKWALPLAPAKLPDGLSWPRNKQFDETAPLAGLPDVDI